jgi:hypothetical protein
MSEIVNAASTETPVSPDKAATQDTPASSTQKPDDMSAKFASLAKKERFARMQLGQVKKLQANLAERERQIAERERTWDQEFKTSPLDAIKKRGYSYEDLTKAALNDGKPDASTEVRAVREDIEKLRQEQLDRDKKAKEDAQSNQQRTEQATIEQFKENISAKIEEKKDTYELVNLWNAAPLVFDTIEEHYNRTLKEGKPKILSIEEACQLTEEYLENEAFEKLSASKKFQSRFSKLQSKEEPRNQSRESRTLSNDMVSSSAPSLLPAATENDRLKRALAKLG